MMNEERRIETEEVEAVTPPPRARVAPETPSETFGRKRDYLAGLITKLGAPKGKVPTDMDLLDFAEPAWIVSTLGVGYDDDHDRIIVEAHELFEEEEEGQRAGEEPASARVRLTREQAQAFVDRATELMKSGRPNCPVCSEPMDASGHVCRRSNGHIVH